jgi:uncharacterized protein
LHDTKLKILRQYNKSIIVRCIFYITLIFTFVKNRPLEKPDKRIIDFIRKHHVLTLATTVNHRPWCANCFYSYFSEDNVLIFTSDVDTRHICEAIENTNVAGSIVLETKIIGKIQGIQFEGLIYKTNNENSAKFKNSYLKRFPFAIIATSPLWYIELMHIKFTDNRLGFGKKMIWKKELK